MSRPLGSQLVVDHLDRMYRAAWAMCGSPHDAEDLVQDTCRRLLAKPRQIQNGDEIGYLLTALHNTHINRHRTVACRPQQGASLDDVEIADMRPDASTVNRVRAREVMGYLSGLPDSLREVIVAVDIMGLSRAETSVQLDLSERVVAERLTRARISVDARLQPDRVTCG